MISFWCQWCFMSITHMVSWCLSTTFNFPDSDPVEVKTVVYVLSPADGPLIVLKQACRRWEGKDSWSEELGRQPEWKAKEPGDQWRINSTVKLCVMSLCACFFVESKTGQDLLNPRYLLSLISVAAFIHPTKWNLPLWECFCSNL